jgi:hypothetical protein
MLATFHEKIWIYFVGPVLGLFAPDEFSFARRARIVPRACVVVATVLLAVAYFTAQPLKLMNAAGILFDIAGAIRLFITEQIDEWLEPFKDEEQYPYGPPSHAMRELIMPEVSPFHERTVPTMYHTYYHKRGILYLLTGFGLQLVATLLA